MEEELKGEWKLLKVWECHRCKELIRYGRDISEHKCDQVKEKIVEKVVYTEPKTVEKIVYVDKPKIVEKIVEKPVEIPVEKIVEKIIYVNKPLDNDNIGNNEENTSLNIDIWTEGPIKDSKDIGYRENVEIEVYEKGKEKKRIIIKNGKMVKKPDDINLVGIKTSAGFILKGITKKY